MHVLGALLLLLHSGAAEDVPGEWLRYRRPADRHRAGRLASRDLRRADFVWGMFFDAIHHRGQLTTYLRPMGGKVPSIYGPSGDDPGGS